MAQDRVRWLLAAAIEMIRYDTAQVALEFRPHFARLLLETKGRWMSRADRRSQRANEAHQRVLAGGRAEMGGLQRVFRIVQRQAEKARKGTGIDALRIVMAEIQYHRRWRARSRLRRS